MDNRYSGWDVGSASESYARVDFANQEIGPVTVRVFPEGKDRRSETSEKTRGEGRRSARHARRGNQRRSKRLEQLKKFLGSVGMSPDISRNPLELRARALHEKLSLPELGRVFLHLAARRGFKFVDLTDEEKSQLKKNARDIETIIESGRYETVGEYLYDCFKTGKPTRGKHITRNLYHDEFDRIWKTQAEYHPQLTDSLRYGNVGPQTYPVVPRPIPPGKSWGEQYGIEGLIYFQRKQWWKRDTIGRCSLEPKKPRIRSVHPLYQDYCVLSQINTLEYVNAETGEILTLGSRDRMTLLSHSHELTSWTKIKELLNIREKDYKFNLEEGGLKPCQATTLATIRSICGDMWDSFDSTKRNYIIDRLLDDQIESQKKMNQFVSIGLPTEIAKKLASVDLPAGRGSLSHKAISKILPFLRKGLKEPHAQVGAGYSTKKSNKIKKGEIPAIDPYLPPVPAKALTEVRKTLIALLKEYPTIREDVHVVELARDVRSSKKVREDRAKRNKYFEKLNDNARKLLENRGIKNPSKKQIKTARLLEDQGWKCLYCGRSLTVLDIQNGRVQDEHILPKSRTNDSSYDNLSAACNQCNQKKDNKTPMEFLGEQRLDLIISRLVNPKNNKKKIENIKTKDLKREDFENRQLAETGHIATATKKHLESCGIDHVRITNGKEVSALRSAWGLNYILNDETGKKNRLDHRHHAIDAIVIACLPYVRKMYGEHFHSRLKLENIRIQPPWLTFQRDVETVVKKINVSHAANRGITGALHNATLYGKRANGYVVKHPVSWFTSRSRIAKIVDSGMQDRLLEYLEKKGINTEKTISPSSLDGFTDFSGHPVTSIKTYAKKGTYVEIRPGQHVAPMNNYGIGYYRDKKGKIRAEVPTMLEAAIRIRHHKAPFLNECFTTFQIGELFVMNEKLYRVVKTGGDKLYYWDAHLERPKGETTSPPTLSPSKIVNIQKVTVDRLGRIRNAGD